MKGRLSLLLFCLLLSPPAEATNLRFIFPPTFANDVFVKSMLSSKALIDVGLVLTPVQAKSQDDAVEALKTGAADIGAFALSDAQLRAQDGNSAGGALLNQPFMYQSASDVMLMRNSFLGGAAAADAGRSGLFPLKLWTHGITYFLTRTPVRSAEEFAKLKVAAANGAPNVKILSAVGAKAVATGPAPKSGAMISMTGGAADAIETRLGAAAQKLAKNYGGKLYLTTGWPQTAMIAAAPGPWMKLSEAEKNALKVAAVEALKVADADIMARENKIAAMPNIEINRLGHDARMTLAMRAGGGADAMKTEMTLWQKAEREVHARPSPAYQLAESRPAPKMAAETPVFFVTDRDDEDTLDYATRFGSRRLHPFEYTCGFLGAPPRHGGEMKLPPAPKDLPKGAETCAKLIVSRTRAAGFKKVMILVHGFNTSFDDLATRALQLGSDLDYAGTIVGWSWPSEDSAFGYAYDEDSSAWSEPHLVELVQDLAAAGPELQYDFVAHSMGNRMMLQMLRELAQAHAKIHVGVAVFAAPDVSQDVFREQIRIADKLGALRTLYASEFDRAILISEAYHSAPRAGSGGPAILVVNGLESVDARLGGHSYVFEEPKAMMDFKKLVNHETPAPKRGLQPEEKTGKPYWVIEP